MWKLGLIILVPESGQLFLKVAGYHLGEARLIGERGNALSIKVEKVEQNEQIENCSKDPSK